MLEHIEYLEERAYNLHRDIKELQEEIDYYQEEDEEKELLIGIREEKEAEIYFIQKEIRELRS